MTTTDRGLRFSVAVGYQPAGLSQSKTGTQVQHYTVTLATTIYSPLYSYQTLGQILAEDDLPPQNRTHSGTMS